MNDSVPATPEQILWRGTVSHLHYFGKWLLVFLLFIATAASFFVPLPASADPLIWGGRAALVITAFLVFGWIQLDRRRRKYTVTNRRVSVEFGIINKTSNEIRIQDVRSMNLRKHGIGGLLGIGTLEFSSAATDDADVTFWNAPEAEKARDLVRALQT